MITILEETTKKPITTIGKMSGICYGSDITNDEKNYKRGLDCLANNHGRTLESVDVYMIIDGYSAKVIRELYTHIGGSPMRLQESTRYIDYANKGLEIITPPAIEKNEEAKILYEEAVDIISRTAQTLEKLGIAKEDASMLFPLAMKSKCVLKCNLRMLIEMSHQRMCSRAFWEFRLLMNEICVRLSDIDSEWADIVKNYFKPKCEVSGYCVEKFSCGKKSRKEQ